MAAVFAVAENNGILESVQQGCQAALAIAEKEGYPSAEISTLLYRLGRIERQRYEFTEAEKLMRRSLAIEEQQGGEQTAVAVRLTELALSLAGQKRWADGAQVLERSAPLVGDLTGREGKAAAGTFQLFAVRLRMLGETAQADRFQAKVRELAQL